jgi:hypothetical protein
VKFPEPVVNAVDNNPAGAPRFLLTGGETFGHHQRADTVDGSGEPGKDSNILGELFANESGGDHDMVRLAETLQYQVAQAPSHGIANQQGSSEYGDSGSDTEHDGGVRAPVVCQASKNEKSGVHCNRFNFRSVSSKRIGNWDASCTLCVTTTSMIC